MLVASPRYLERAGLPRKPADLASHALILGQPGMRPDGWAFRSQRRSMSIRLEGKLNMTVNEVAIRAAVSGVGIASSSIWGCRNELQQGDLVRVLPEWETCTVVSTQWFPQVARRSRHQGPS
jgi:DNA-binding transcriptional LysR family regulator